MEKDCVDWELLSVKKRKQERETDFSDVSEEETIHKKNAGLTDIG